MSNHDHEEELVPKMGYPETHVKLASNRVIFIAENIADTMASQLSAMLFYLDNEDHEAPINMYIHSNGGQISGLFNIYDVMQMIQAPVRTFCIGKCYSAGAFLLAAGSAGQRFAFKNSSIMIHGIQCGFPIPGHDIVSSKNYYEFLEENNDNIMKIFAKHTGHTLAKVKEDCKQDVWLTAEEAKKYGLVDHIVG